MPTFISRGKTVKTYCTSSLLKHLQGKRLTEYRAMQESKKRKATEEEQNNQVTKKPKPSQQTIESTAT